MQVIRVKSNQLLYNHANKTEDCLCLFEDNWRDRNNKISDVPLKPFMFLNTPMSSFVSIGISKNHMFSDLSEAKPYLDMSFQRIQSIFTHFSKKCLVIHDKMAKDVPLDVFEYIMKKIDSVQLDSPAPQLYEILRSETSFELQEEKQKNDKHRPCKKLKQSNVCVKQPKIFPGAPSKTTLRAVGFPFFEECDFDVKGELKKQADFEWSNTAWPMIPLSMKIKFYKEWCSFRFEMSMRRGSLYQNTFWVEWLQKFEKQNPTVITEEQKKQML